MSTKLWLVLHLNQSKSFLAGPLKDPLSSLHPSIFLYNHCKALVLYLFLVYTHDTFLYKTTGLHACRCKHSILGSMFCFLPKRWPCTLSKEHWWLGSCTVITLSWFEGHWPATHTLHKFCFFESSKSTALSFNIFSTSPCYLRLCLRGIYFTKWFGLDIKL